MRYWILIRFQGQEYRSVETYGSFTEASDEGHRRFDGTPVFFDVYTDENTLGVRHEARA